MTFEDNFRHGGHSLLMKSLTRRQFTKDKAREGRFTKDKGLRSRRPEPKLPMMTSFLFEGGPEGLPSFEAKEAAQPPNDILRFTNDEA